jgi:hypothetical protein
MRQNELRKLLIVTTKKFAFPKSYNRKEQHDIVFGYDIVDCNNSSRFLFHKNFSVNIGEVDEYLSLPRNKTKLVNIIVARIYHE